MQVFEKLVALFLFILLGVVVIKNAAQVGTLVTAGSQGFTSIAGAVTGNSTGTGVAPLAPIS